MLASENFNVWLFTDAMGATTFKLGRKIPGIGLYNFAEYHWHWHIFRVTGLHWMKNVMHHCLRDCSTKWGQIWYEYLFTFLGIAMVSNTEALWALILYCVINSQLDPKVGHSTDNTVSTVQINLFTEAFLFLGWQRLKMTSQLWCNYE